MIYLDNSATSGYAPQCMLDAMLSELSTPCNAGRSAHNMALSLSEKIFNTRETLKDVLRAKNNYNIIFTKNTTEALNIAILGYLATFKGQVHVITTMLEHNSVLRPLKYLSNKSVIDVTILPINNGTINIPDIELHIKNNTRLIVLSHTSNVLGSTIDLEYASEISRAYNIPLLIDTAQSLGHIRYDLDNSNIAMLAAAGHKGLNGPEGTGFLAVRKDIYLSPIMYGGTGTNSANLSGNIEYPESFEVGTINAPGIVGLGESARWTYQHFDEINSKIDSLSHRLYDYLLERDDITVYTPYCSNVISFNVANYSSGEVSDYLNDNDIAVRSGLHCAPLVHSYYGTLRRGMVRASIGYNNSDEDISAMISALAEIK